MSWTETKCHHCDRRELSYASDCTDREWEIIVIFLERTGWGRHPVHAQHARNMECD